MLDFYENLFVIVKIMSNFLFLKKNTEKLFNIITEAECLFRDEYFEQSMVQIRRFAENLCKDMLQDKILPEDTFDTIIEKIKDNSFQNIRMSELANDLYFIKKQGNTSAHSSNATKDGELALDCLERAYEISIFYSNAKFGYDKKLDKTVFSEELLMTGKKTGKESSPILLKERYTDELKTARLKPKSSNAKPKKAPKTFKKQESEGKEENILGIILSVAVVSLIIFIYLFQMVIKNTHFLNVKQREGKIAPHQIAKMKKY
jgi:ABC-type Na+ efflux pump permease subunit